MLTVVTVTIVTHITHSLGIADFTTGAANNKHDKYGKQNKRCMGLGALLLSVKYAIPELYYFTPDCKV